jgi:hypothetical protein
MRSLPFRLTRVVALAASVACTGVPAKEGKSDALPGDSTLTANTATALTAADEQAQGALTLTPQRLPDLAGWILLDSIRPRDVPRPADVDSDIFAVRLYELGEIGGCQGSDAVCRNRYALLIATGGMPGGVALYDLGLVGEITDITWTSSPPPRALSESPRMLDLSDEAMLALTVQNFPTRVLDWDRTIVRQTKRYRLSVSLTRISVEELR